MLLLVLQLQLPSLNGFLLGKTKVVVEAALVELDLVVVLVVGMVPVQVLLSPFLYVAPGLA